MLRVSGSGVPGITSTFGIWITSTKKSMMHVASATGPLAAPRTTDPTVGTNSILVLVGADVVDVERLALARGAVATERDRVDLQHVRLPEAGRAVAARDRVRGGRACRDHRERGQRDLVVDLEHRGDVLDRQLRRDVGSDRSSPGRRSWGCRSRARTRSPPTPTRRQRTTRRTWPPEPQREHAPCDGAGCCWSCHASFMGGRRARAIARKRALVRRSPLAMQLPH